jgi:hypothetical protein
MWGSAVNSSEGRRGADPRPGRLSDIPSLGMDDRRHRTSRSISPSGVHGRLHRYDIKW